jgi:hypothetical protein
MASSYPLSLDALATNKTDATPGVGDHAQHHDDMADAINKIEAELGTNPSGGYATVALRNGISYNVIDYGAKGDGSTDDTIAIQAAITAAMNVPGQVLFPDTGNPYVITNLAIDFSTFGLQASSGPPYGYAAPRLSGIGRRSARLQQKTGATGPMIMAQGQIGTNVGASHNNKISGLLIENLELIGTTGATNHGIQLRSFVDCTLRGIHIRACGGSGIKLLRETFVANVNDEYSYGLTLDNIKILACSRYGVECSGTNAIGTTFRDVDATACTLGGFYLCPADMSLYFCKSIANGGPGFQTVRCSNVSSSNLSINFLGCHEEGSNNVAGNYCVQIDGVQTFKWSGGTVLEGGSAGHLFGIGTAGTGDLVRGEIENCSISGRSTQAGQMAFVLGTDSNHTTLKTQTITTTLSSFNGTPVDVFRLITDNGSSTHYPELDTASSSSR